MEAHLHLYKYHLRWHHPLVKRDGLLEALTTAVCVPHQQTEHTVVVPVRGGVVHP